MSQPIRRRIEALEQAAADNGEKIDFSGLTDIEFEVYRTAITELQAKAITPKEAADLCALATGGVQFPFPIRSEPSFGRPSYLRVLIGGEVRYQRWHGWPGYRPLGWERYLYVGPDGALMRVDGTAVFPATLHDRTAVGITT